MAKINLKQEWVEFLCDKAQNILNPTLTVNGGYITAFELTDLTRYGVFNLFEATTRLVKTHGTLIFTRGLPEMPHDFGLSISSVRVTPHCVEVTFAVPYDRKLHKPGKKAQRCTTLVASDGPMSCLRQFGLPISWRFEGGKQRKSPKSD